jgi:hypothetical protein
MTDNPNSSTSSGFNRRTFIAVKGLTGATVLRSMPSSMSYCASTTRLVQNSHSWTSRNQRRPRHRDEEVCKARA